MSFWLRSLVLCLAVGFGLQASGALEMFAPCCEDACPEDNEDGRCPPTCASCAILKVAQSRVWHSFAEQIALTDGAEAVWVPDLRATDGVRDAVFHPPKA